MSDYNFNRVVHLDQWTIAIDTDARYGFFERDTDGTGGGLWFELSKKRDERGDRQMELVDYDGVGVLPRVVSEALRNAGFLVDEDF